VQALSLSTRGYPLQIHHAECEVNFQRLARLLPEFTAGQRLRIGLRMAPGHEERLELRVLERSPYTAEIELRQSKAIWRGRRTYLRVRVYLDVRMAEVVGCERSLRLLPRYPYPNDKGLARDEKWQLDQLLGEWLACCLADGHSLTPPLALGA
jgi:hypothetical protein